MAEEKVGVITHYFGKIGVAAITLTDGELAAGDRIRIKGHTSDFYQDVDSIQIEHETVEKGVRGSNVGIKVKEHAREHDIVYKVIED